MRLAMRFVSRLFLRAAAFLWMTPLAAALSMRLIARRSASGVFSAPVSADETATFTRVFSSERTALLRRRAFSFCRLRLIWLLMFATSDYLLTRVEGTGRR